MNRLFIFSFHIFVFAFPCHAQGIRQHADIFVDLCVDERFHPGTDDPPRTFDSAVKITDETGLSELLPSTPFSQKEAWTLNPEADERDQMVLFAALWDHPTMGQLGVCILMINSADGAEIKRDLIDIGAEEDGEFLFLSGPSHLWQIAEPSGDIEGGAVIMGTTNNTPITEEP